MNKAPRDQQPQGRRQRVPRIRLVSVDGSSDSQKLIKNHSMKGSLQKAILSAWDRYTKSRDKAKFSFLKGGKTQAPHQAKSSKPRNLADLQNRILENQERVELCLQVTQSVSDLEPIVESLLARYPIKRKGTRNNVLMQLVGELIHKFGREAAGRIIEEHYRRNQENIGSTLDDHRREFATAWEGMRKKLVDSFSATEQQAFNALASEHQREGFLIVHAFAGAAEHDGRSDFAISQASLADRLSITRPGARDVIQKLRECEPKAIAPTQGYVRHKKSARFCWMLKP